MVQLAALATLALLSASSALASHAGEPVLHRRGAVMGHPNTGRMQVLQKRQNVTEPTTKPADTAAATTSPPADDTKPATTSTDLLGPLLGTDTTSPTNAAPGTTGASTTPPAEASSANAPTTTSAKGKAPTTTPAASSDKNLVTETSTLPLSSSDTSALSSTASSSTVSGEPEKSGSSSSGINHATLIVIIVVASSVAGIAAIWTIIRKTKFSPSRRFEAKLEPIDFVPGKRDTFDGGAGGFGMLGHHDRSGSSMGGSIHRQGTYVGGGGHGYAASLARSDSGGKSLRQEPMSQVSHMPGSIPYNAQPSYGHQPYYPQGSAVGYAQEQAYGYGDVQRGATVSSRGGGGGGSYQYHGSSSHSIAAASQGSSAPAYDYAAQQRSARY